MSEEDDLLLPSTPSHRERETSALLCLDVPQTEAAAPLGRRRKEMERAVKLIRQKLATGPRRYPSASRRDHRLRP